MADFTKDQILNVGAFLKQVRDCARIDRAEWLEAYQSWARGARIWRVVYGFSGTDINTALWWYQYRHAPGSRDWRPVVILRALVKASEYDYTEPERLPVNDTVLQSASADKKQARLAFIRQHGVRAFHQEVKPWLKRRRGGVSRLCQVQATEHIRHYINILSDIAERRKLHN